METVRVVKEFIVSSFENVPSDISEEEQLIDSGIIDSMGILKVLGFIEKQFGVKVPERDVTPDNFDSITTIASYIDRRKGK